MNTPSLPYRDTCREIKMLRLGIPLVGGSNQTMDNRIWKKVAALKQCIPQSEQHVVDSILNTTPVPYPAIPLTSDNITDLHAQCSTLIAELKEQNEQLRNELSVFKCTTNDLLAKTNCALQRISLIPCARQTPRTTITNAPTPYESTLSKKPRNLYFCGKSICLGLQVEGQRGSSVV